MNEIRHLSWAEIYERLDNLDRSKLYWGIPTGGSIVAGLTGNAVDTPEEADIIIDDLYDSGRTAKRYEYLNKPIIFLYNKQTEEDIKNIWLVFPWEEPDTTKDIDDHIARILEHYGEENIEFWGDIFKRYIERFFEPN